MSRCSSPLSISRSAEMGKAAVRECARDVVGHTDQDSAEPLVDNVRSADDEIILRRFVGQQMLKLIWLRKA